MRGLVLIVAVMGFAGCVTDSVAWDRSVRPVAAPGSSPEFAARVDEAAFIWKRTLACEDVFSGTSGTQPIYEVTPGDLASAGLGPTVSGEAWSDKVWISNIRPEMENEILVHELGHVLGLEHIAPVDDPTSVMHPNDDGIVIPDVVDVEHVGCR